MCGRYTLTRHEKIIEDLEAALDLSAAQDPWWKPRFNVAPTQPAPVITARDGTRTLALMRWGLVPFWADLAGKKPPLLINARLESLNAKQFFREALQHRRCLVPADGFFEWVSRAQPFYFHPRSHGLFAFAGLWARSRDAAGNELHSFTIITTRASELVRPIHDRMPIVLDPSSYAAWLDPAVDGAHARALLAGQGPAMAGGDPAGAAGGAEGKASGAIIGGVAGDWVREPVSTWVNKADHDDPSCIAPAPSDAPAQRRLFE